MSANACFSALPRHSYPSLHSSHRQTLPSAKFRAGSVTVRRKNSTRISGIVRAAVDGEVSAQRRPAAKEEKLLQTVAVEEDGVPVEGVIKFDKFDTPWRNWRRVAILVGGDVLALLTFSAIGRLSHGMPVLDWETLHTADPFIAGWLLGAYFLGGFESEGLGINGVTKAVFAATKSWVVGIPLGLAIRGVQAGHFPASAFILVSLGSTFVLLIGWRAVFTALFPNDEQSRKKREIYKKGSPLELFELLSSLVRRW